MKSCALALVRRASHPLPPAREAELVQLMKQYFKTEQPTQSSVATLTPTAHPLTPHLTQHKYTTK